MKNILVFLITFFLIPTMNVNAWVGGPFDNNSFTPNGDDGIYEAVAIPTVGNGIGLMRWGVFNQNPGGTAFTNGQTGTTGNVQFGGQSGSYGQSVFYLNGQSYFGTAIGTANSVINSVSCIASGSTMGNVLQDTPSTGSPLITTTGPAFRLIVNPLSPTGDFYREPDGSLTQFALGNFFHAYFDGQIMNSALGFDGRIGGRNFSGQGVITFDSAPPTPPVPLQVFGSRVSLVVSG